MRAVPLIPIVLVAAVAAAPHDAQGQPPPEPRPPSTAPRTGSLQVSQSVQTFLGGVPTGTATGDPITITVIDAIRRALDHNLGVLTADEQLGRISGDRWVALANLLPNVNARVTETRQVFNLAAFGFGSSSGGPFAGLPTLVGPFNVFDARVFLSQSIFDANAVHNARAESHNVQSARLLQQSARDLVIHVAGDLYIQALAASASADSARAQQETAEALHTQAVDLKTSGMVAGIDVLRAQVQLETDTQRVTSTVNEFEKTKLQLARVIGLPLGQAFLLDPDLPQLPNPDLPFEQTVERAFQQRPDYQAAIERIKAAEATRSAAIGEALPTAQVTADYGAIGLTPAQAQTTFSVVGGVNVPIFQGGRAHGRLLQADADLRQRKAEADDLRASIYYEVRTAYLDLQATQQQLEVATRARDLAAQALTQARDRFTAGVGNNIEVIQAQESVALASAQFINAQFGFDLAKGALIRGIGASQEVLRQISGGGR